MEQLQDILTAVTPYIGTATQIVGVFAIIARFTPTPIDNIVAIAAKNLINLIAMNSGPAENVEIPGDRASVEERKKRHASKKKRYGPRSK